MATVTTHLTWDGELQFTGKTASGLTTVMDGNRQAGASPMELLLEATGGCSAIDVVLILQKMRLNLARLEVSLDGERNETEPKYYTNITMRFDVWGEELSADKVARAINLSIGKYCSVFHSLRKDLQFAAEYRLHAAGAEATGDYQAVAFTAPE